MCCLPQGDGDPGAAAAFLLLWADEELRASLRLTHVKVSCAEPGRAALLLTGSAAEQECSRDVGVDCSNVTQPSAGSADPPTLK